MKRKKELLFRTGLRYLTTVCCCCMLAGSVVLAAGQQDVVSAYAAEDGVIGFVKRLYALILEREPDVGGVQTWTGVLNDGSWTGAQVAEGFIMSDEFLGKDMTNEEFVEIMYRTFLDREADGAGLATWTGFLEQGYVKKFVFAGFVNSDEFQTICNGYEINRGYIALTPEEQTPVTPEPTLEVGQFVERLYSEILGRAADEEGLNMWVGLLEDGSWTGAQVAEGFILSDEFINTEMTEEEFVKIMYQTFFDREADSEGLATWTNALADGYSKQFVFAGFANSTEFGTLCEEYGIEQGSVVVPADPVVTPIPKPETPAEAFSWEVKEDGTVEITGLKDTTLTELMIPSKIEGKDVTSIGNWAFSEHTRITSVELLDSVASIGDYAFYYCSGLTSIELPDSMTSIGSYAFGCCYNLRSIELPDSVTNIGANAFWWCGITSIEIPDSMTSIGEDAFSGLGITSIDIPDSVTSIESGAFSDCRSLTSIEIPNSVTSIGSWAFSDCNSLTSIEIPNSVTSIGDCAFDNCDLETVYVKQGSYADMWARENNYNVSYIQ